MVHLEDFRGRNVLESIRSVSQGRKNVDGNMQRITKMAKLLRNRCKHCLTTNNTSKSHTNKSI